MAEARMVEMMATEPPKFRLSKSARVDLAARFDGRCAYCGSPLGDRWHADHMDPVIRETKYVRGKGYVQTGKVLHEARDCLENMMPACAPCNINKGSLCLEGWRRELGRTLEIMQRNYPTYRTAVRFGFVVELPQPVEFFFERHSPPPSRADG